MDKLKNYFKNKKILVISTTCTHIHDHYLKNTHPFFQKIFGKIILFDTRINFYKYGKGDLNKKIMKIVKDEKPDYILFEFGYDEISLKTFDKIREILPETKILAHLGDDNWKFDDFSRYYSLFLDYVLVSEKDDSYYKKDGIKNTFFIGGANLNMFKPLNIKKKYDVTFIGNPIRDRPDFLRFLIKNNINVKIFSELWSSYPDLKDAWGGFLDEKKITEIINSSKINLNFSKTFIKCKKNTQMKGRIFEVLACKSFLLTEHFDGIELYLDGADKISFKTKKELLEKINYFLKNEEEREKLTQKLHRKIIKEFVWEKHLEKAFKEIMKKDKDFIRKPLPQISKKIIYISEEDINADFGQLKGKVKEYDYVCFKKDNPKISPYRDYLQAYSLEKSGKDISCCDYYVCSKWINDYMLFMAKRAFNFISKENFSMLINLNQLMITKDFFLKHLENFKKAFCRKQFNLINEKNTVFVSIPLIKIRNLNVIDYHIMREAFRMRFVDTLFSLISQKKIISSSYPYKLFLYGLLKERFIIKHLLISLLDSVNWEKIKTL